MKTISYCNVKYARRLPLLLLTVENIECENFDFVLLSSFIPFFSFMHNSNTVQCIHKICTPNDCSTIRDFPFLGQSCMQAKISKLWLQPCIMVSFLCNILCVLKCLIRKLKVVFGLSTYQTTALLS